MKKLVVFIAAFAMVASCALSAAAAEWNFYGSARMATFSVDDDPGDGNGDSNRNTTWDLQGNARIGANVKVSDELKGGFEYGSGPNLRKLFAEWNFGAGKLLVGQTYTPTSKYFYANQVFGSDNDFLNSGQQYAGRQPMIRLSFGDLQIAFVKPKTGNEPAIPGTREVTWPKFEVAYNMKFDAFFVDVSGGYNTYEVGNEDIDSYVAALGGGADFGAAYIKANVYIAQNGSTYGLSGLGDASVMYNPAGGGDIVDCDTLGALGVLGFKVNDMLTLEAGYGYIEHDSDASGYDSDESATIYVNATVHLAPGVFIVPEFGFIDYDDDAFGNDEGDTTYFGAKWQMNF